MGAITVAKADVRPLPGCLSVRIQAAEIIDLGEVVYVDSAGKAALADADALGSSEILGVVVSAPNGVTTCAADDWLDVVYIGPVRWGAGMTLGGYVFASVTAGSGDQTAPVSTGDCIAVIGIALRADRLLVNPFIDTTVIP